MHGANIIFILQRKKWGSQINQLINEVHTLLPNSLTHTLENPYRQWETNSMSQSRIVAFWSRVKKKWEAEKLRLRTSHFNASKSDAHKITTIPWSIQRKYQDEKPRKCLDFTARWPLSHPAFVPPGSPPALRSAFPPCGHSCCAAIRPLPGGFTRRTHRGPAGSSSPNQLTHVSERTHRRKHPC